MLYSIIVYVLFPSRFIMYFCLSLLFFLDCPASSESKLLLHLKTKSWNDHLITFTFNDKLGWHDVPIVPAFEFENEIWHHFEFTKASSNNLIPLPVKIQCTSILKYVYLQQLSLISHYIHTPENLVILSYLSFFITLIPIQINPVITNIALFFFAFSLILQ